MGLCDQLIFLCEWFATVQPTWTTPCEEGFWVVDRAKGFTSVNATDVAENALGIKAKQPVLDQPLNKEVVGKLRSVLEVYFFMHLEMHDLHAKIEVPGDSQISSCTGPERVIEDFRSVDTENTGMIAVEHLEAVMAALGATGALGSGGSHQLSPELRRVCSQFSVNGMVDYTKWVYWIFEGTY